MQNRKKSEIGKEFVFSTLRGVSQKEGGRRPPLHASIVKFRTKRHAAK